MSNEGIEKGAMLLLSLERFDDAITGFESAIKLQPENAEGYYDLAEAQHIKGGKVRALANLGPKRIPSMPDLPTVAEQGFPGFKVTNRYGLQAPAGTPKEIVLALNRVVGEGMYDAKLKARLAADGSEPATVSPTPSASLAIPQASTVPSE